MYLQKVISKTNYTFFAGTLEFSDKNSCSRIRIHQSDARILGSGSVSKCHGSGTPWLQPWVLTQLSSSHGGQQMCTVTFSVVDSGCLARNLIFPSQIQGQKDPRSASASKNLSILVVHAGSDFYPSLIPDPGVKRAPDPDPQHCDSHDSSTWRSNVCHPSVTFFVLGWRATPARWSALRSSCTRSSQTGGTRRGWRRSLRPPAATAATPSPPPHTAAPAAPAPRMRGSASSVTPSPGTAELF